MKALMTLSLCMLTASCTTTTKQANLNMPKRGVAQEEDRIPLNDTQLNEAFEAARTGETEVLRDFHNKGYDANTPDKDGYTPAHFAGAMGKVEVLSFFKNHEYNLNVLDKNGDTPEDLYKLFNRSCRY